MRGDSAPPWAYAPGAFPEYPPLSCTLVVLSPVFFSGLVFARSFRGTRAAGPAMGANMLGAVLGGWAEYATMAVGIRALLLLALGFYAASALSLRLAAGAGARVARLSPGGSAR